MADALCVNALHVTLAGKRVLHDVSFEVPRGELFGILGPNGAGKTTLLKAIAGLCPHEGAIAVAGQPLHSLDARARARCVAYVPQRSLLNAPLSAYGVVAQGRYCHGGGLGDLSPADRRAIESALDAMRATAFSSRPFNELSGGEQRRVLLARALATEAPLILLDEPIASLDVAQALSVFHHVKQLLPAGHTVLVVLHDLDQALAWSSSALLLAQGQVVAQGSPRDVISAEHVRRVYGVELGEKTALSYRIPGSPA